MKKVKAFTLMELLIIVAIIAILAAIAIPSYQHFVEKARRSDAKQALLAASEAMERYKAANFSYSGVTLSNIFNVYVPTDGGASSAYYTLELSNLSNTTYTLTAKATGSMSGDGDLSINQAGERKYKGAAGWPD